MAGKEICRGSETQVEPLKAGLRMLIDYGLEGLPEDYDFYIRYLCIDSSSL